MAQGSYFGMVSGGGIVLYRLNFLVFSDGSF